MTSYSRDTSLKVVVGYSVCICVDREGSVIADLELTFNRPVYENDVDGLLKEATKDKSLGGIPVSQVVVGKKISEFYLFICLFIAVDNGRPQF